MKIALVIPSLHAGGMERVMSELACYFAVKESVQVHILLYGISPEIFYPLSDKVIIHKPSLDFDNKRRTLSTIKRLLYLRKEIKNLHPDTILSFGDFWNSFVLLALRGFNYPIYISDRSQPDKPLSFFYRTLRKMLYPKATGIIAQTQKAKDIYELYFDHRNIKIIGNPIREIPGGDYDAKENVVVSVGRLIPSKHHDQLIKLFAGLNIPGWKLLIVGGDALNRTLSEKLQILIDQINANDRIILAGTQTNVEQYLQRSKVFAFTSSSEGFPNVIGEAMSAGLPVVAFDCVAGPSDMIEDDRTGYLIPLFDYKMFSERLGDLMLDEQKQRLFGQHGKESIKRFSRERISEAFFEFITSHIKRLDENSAN